MNSNDENVINKLMYIYEWVDSMKLSRAKKNISRDFSDGQLLSEILKYYLPKMVDLNNYPPASNTNQKCYNWTTLNNKVLKKIGIKLNKQEINDIIMCKNFAIEHILEKVYKGIEKYTGKNIGFKSNNNNVNNENNNDKNNSENLLEELNNKKKIIEELNNTIENLKIQLNESINIKNSLEKKINELKNKK